MKFALNVRPALLEGRFTVNEDGLSPADCKN